MSYDATTSLTFWEPGRLSHLFFEQTGRLTRLGFLLGTLLLVFLTAVGVTIFATMGVFMEAAGFSLVRDVCFFIPVFLFVYSFSTMIVKRLHDIGFSGWWAFGGLIPLIGTISLFIVVFFIPGSQETNAFGRPV